MSYAITFGNQISWSNETVDPSGPICYYVHPAWPYTVWEVQRRCKIFILTNGKRDGPYIDQFCKSPGTVEISADEAMATGWRLDLAKPTTYEDCEQASYNWNNAQKCCGPYCTFETWLELSRSQANSGRVGEPYKHAAAGSTPAPDTKPRDFLSWLASESKRAACGDLPPLQRAHMDAMLARRQERERVEREANKFHLDETCAALKRRLDAKRRPDGTWKDLDHEATCMCVECMPTKKESDNG